MPKITSQENAWYNKIRKHRASIGKMPNQLQDKSCNQYPEMTDLVKCRPCQDPEPQEENCLFKDFRAFRVLKKGLRFGYYFPDAIQQTSPLSHSSKRFNQNKPYDPADRSYLKSKLRGILKDTFAQDQPIHNRLAKSHAALLRKGFEGYRHVCDICLTSIFNHHYFCPACAIDICLQCYNSWRSVKKDSTKTACYGGMNHSPQMFMLSKKYSQKDTDVVMEELDDLDKLDVLDDLSDLSDLSDFDDFDKLDDLSDLSDFDGSEDEFIGVAGDDSEVEMESAIKKSADNEQKPSPSLLPLTPDSDDQHDDYIKSGGYVPVTMINTGATDSNNEATSSSNDAKDTSSRINQAKYGHLDGVTITEATSRSLPTTIADAVTMTTKTFQEIWQDKNPLLVENCLNNSKVSWNPKHFGEEYGSQEIEVIDCKDNTTRTSTVKEFFDSYESEEKLAAYCEKMGTSNVIKIKDWPPKDDFKQVFNDLHNDYMNNVLPAKEYCSENGYFNISNRLPEEYMPPDLGPKMFISQGSDPNIKSCTKLHCDMADAVNVMCFSKTNTAASKWEIFASKDLPQLRTFVHNLNKKKKRNFRSDPILSESTYLDDDDLMQLENQTGIKPYRFYQKPGDAVFVPAGCAHQVQNITGAIKCAYDFLSPETMQESSLITSHFQNIQFEDKLQLKTTALYAWKSL